MHLPRLRVLPVLPGPARRARPSGLAGPWGPSALWSLSGPSGRRPARSTWRPSRPPSRAWSCWSRH